MTSNMAPEPKSHVSPAALGDLASDSKFATQMENFQGTIDNVGTVLEKLCGSTVYSKLPTDSKVAYDLYMSYTLSSLYWVYLRTQGVDPNENQIKVELDRVKATMSRLKRIQDRRTIMPRLDKAAAQRFVRSGMWKPKEKVQEDMQIDAMQEDSTHNDETSADDENQFGPPHVKKGKKRKFND